jgi:hypothetical protein
MEVAIEKLVALSCFVIGLSHILQPRAWAEMFIDWSRKGKVGVFYAGLLHFNLGALIVSFHNVWHGIPMLVTLLGWGWTIKGVIYLTVPAHGLRMLNRVSVDRAWEFSVAGGLIVVVAAVITCSLVARGVV